jgi:hypothetical protein
MIVVSGPQEMRQAHNYHDRAACCARRGKRLEQCGKSVIHNALSVVGGE